MSSFSSLLVPSVQQLAKKSMVTPPSRYIRSDLEAPIISSITSIGEVPVIDMQKLLEEDDAGVELERLHLACKEWGFFQLVDHGVNTELVENLKLQIQEFFNMPPEEKKRFWQQENQMEGFGQAFVMSEEQKLDWADMFFLITLPKIARKPHLFPELPLPLRDVLEEYSLEMKNLAMRIFKVMERALKTKRKEMEDIFEDGFQTMRMNYYPPCPLPEQVIGLTAHSDASGLTILLQVNEVEGLQVRKEGNWIPIKPLPNAFIVNIGDILEIVSNGIYRSIEHRATINNMKERLSIATFYSPKFEAEIKPAEGIVTPQTPALFREIKAEDYFQGLFSQKLDGKSYLDSMRIET
ncbi:hypothetical protein ACHQM5_018141 [Ranunculus cassubicifolius]